MLTPRVALIYLLVLLISLYAKPAYSREQASPMLLQQRHQCVSFAAQRYRLPVALIYAVMRTEGGTTGKTSRANKNGSFDLGLMQINEIHLRELSKYGITRYILINDECVNIQIGAFILSREMAKPDADYWTNVGAYNSRTPCSVFYAKGEPCANIEYQKKVLAHLINILQGK